MSPTADFQVSKNLKRKDRSKFSPFSLLSQSSLLYLESTSLHPGQLSGIRMWVLVHKKPQASLTFEYLILLSIQRETERYEVRMLHTLYFQIHYKLGYYSASKPTFPSTRHQRKSCRSGTALYRRPLVSCQVLLKPGSPSIIWLNLLRS